MAKEMRAVIRAEVDPSGVVKGVARANQELKKLNESSARTAMASGISAAFNVGQVAFNAIRQATSVMNDRVDELTRMATTWDLDAANAQTQALIQKYQDEQTIAKAVAPGVIQAIQAQSAASRAEAQRIATDPTISAGIAAAGQATATAGGLKNFATDQALTGAAGIADIIVILRDIASKMGRPF